MHDNQVSLLTLKKFYGQTVSAFEITGCTEHIATVESHPSLCPRKAE